MRFSTDLTSLSTPVQPRQNGGSVVYRGVTTGNTATELFIDGQARRRLLPDTPAGGLIVARAVAYNVTDNTVLAGTINALFTMSSAGVLTLVDQDSTTAGVQDNVLSALTTAGTRAGVLGVTVGADNGLQFDAVPAVGTPGAPGFVPAYIRLRVRGLAARTVNWEVQADFVEANAFNG